MNLFINDIFVNLQKDETEVSPERFNHKIKCGKAVISRANLIHHVWIQNPANSDIDKILELLNTAVTINLFSITITTGKYLEIKAYIKSKFKIIKAAGGLVKKGDKSLMIYRLKKWDFPKGKINKGESAEDAAVREIKEECNIKVVLGKKICNTWHTYTMKKKPILKKTTWFRLKLKDDSNMKPQIEEDIEELKWMSPKELYHALDNSYRSIQFVINENKKIGAK